MLLLGVNWNKFLIVILIAFLLAVAFSVIILVVYKLCHKDEDETESKVMENLAGANCGGCGFTGCEAFAKALVAGTAKIDDCGVTKTTSKQEIAKILNIPYSVGEDLYAVVKCAGVDSKKKFDFVGNKECVYQVSYFGGEKICDKGCMAGGTCVSKCPYGALTLKDGHIVSDKALCKTCRVCYLNCPKKVIDFIPRSAKVFVACSNLCRDKATRDACKVGCIGCGLCAKNCPNGAIVMVDNKPQIDYSKCTGCKVCVAKCPRKCLKEI